MRERELWPLPGRAQRQPSHAPEAVDADPSAHLSVSGAHDGACVASRSQVSWRRQSRVCRCARVMTCVRHALRQSPRGLRLRTPGFPPRAWCRRIRGEHRQQSGETQLVGGAVAADRIEALEQLADVRLDPSRIARTSSIGLPAGSGISHASTIAGTYGQASPQPIVIAQSACSCISRVSFLGLRPARSRPTSRIASTTAAKSQRRVRCRRTRRASPRARRARRMPGRSASAPRCDRRRTAHRGTISHPAAGRWKARRW